MKVSSLLSIALSLIFYVGVSNAQELIGEVNMISTRNINMNETYECLSRYSGSSKKDFRNSKAKNIDQAVAETVMSVPGGEFLMNVKIYLFKDKYVCVGDVWGKSTNSLFRGFKIGDNVTWRGLTGWEHGQIVSGKDTDRCVVKLANSEKQIIKKYHNLYKVGEVDETQPEEE